MGRTIIVAAPDQSFEASPTYASFAAPALPAALAAVDTEAKRAALDRGDVARRLLLLASRLQTLKMKRDKTPAEEGELASVPDLLKDPGTLLDMAAAAAPADPDVAFWVEQWQSDGSCSAATAATAFAHNPRNVHAARAVIRTVKKALPENASILSAPVPLSTAGGEEAPTVAALLQRLFAVDPHDPWLVEHAAATLDAEHKRARHREYESRSGALGSSPDEDALAAVVAAVEQLPGPTLRIGGHDVGEAALSAQALGLYEEEIEAFGPDAIASCKFPLRPWSPGVRRAAFARSLRVLAHELGADDSVTCGDKTYTAATALQRLFEQGAMQPHDWAAAATAAEAGPLMLGGRRFTAVDCAVACVEAHLPDASAWAFLGAAVGNSIGGGDEAAWAKVDRFGLEPLVTVAGLPLTVFQLVQFCTRPPTSLQQMAEQHAEYAEALLKMREEHSLAAPSWLERNRVWVAASIVVGGLALGLGVALLKKRRR